MAEYIEGEVKRMLAEAEEADATEDAQFGEARGDEPPANLRSRADRLARFDQARAIIVAYRTEQTPSPRNTSPSAGPKRWPSGESSEGGSQRPPRAGLPQGQEGEHDRS